MLTHVVPCARMSARDTCHPTPQKETRMTMNSIDPCDARCPAAALVYVERQGTQLAFCGHCFDIRWADLFRAGWAVREDRRPLVRQQEGKRR